MMLKFLTDSKLIYGEMDIKENDRGVDSIKDTFQGNTEQTGFFFDYLLICDGLKVND